MTLKLRGNRPPSLHERSLQELFIAARFGMVGLAATAAHVGIVWGLIAHLDAPPLLANLAAFLLAFGISFTGNYLWTFSAPGSPGRAVLRFFLIAAAAFAANNILLLALLSSGLLSPPRAAVVSAAIVPGISFIASRLWGFKPPR